nr:hypothetical protein Iba_chr06aCG16750 [Ipomoea batatas]
MADTKEIASSEEGVQDDLLSSKEKKRISEYIGNVKLEQGVESIGSEKLAKEEAEQKVSEDDGDKDLCLFGCKGCRMAWARAVKKILERPRPDDWMAKLAAKKLEKDSGDSGEETEVSEDDEEYICRRGSKDCDCEKLAKEKTEQKVSGDGGEKNEVSEDDDSEKDLCLPGCKGCDI